MLGKVIQINAGKAVQLYGQRNGREPITPSRHYHSRVSDNDLEATSMKATSLLPGGP